MENKEILKQRERFDSMYDFLCWLYELEDTQSIEELKQFIKEETK